MKRVLYVKAGDEGIQFQASTGGYTRKIPVVCGQCNSGWMSDIEESIAGLLGPMMTEEMPTTRLDPESQQRLAVWTCLRGMVADLATEVQRIPDAERHRFHDDHSAPPLGSNVWIGAVRDTKAGIDYIRHAELVVDQHQGAAWGAEANYMCSLMLGTVVLRIACYREAGSQSQLRFVHQPEFDRYLIPIWPSYFTVEWPGTEILDPKEFMRFMFVVPGGMRFTYPT